jgi:hypothetical protein
VRRPLALAVAFLAAAGPSARADTAATFEAVGYVTAVGAGALATAVNGSYLAFAEPAPHGWRLWGYVAGGVDAALGVVIFAAAGNRSEGIVLGSVALAVGAAAATTAFFVEEDAPRAGVVRAVPVVWPGGAGFTFAARF